MRTNKRTVWFLTLLSLVAVISIYTMREKTMSFDGITLFTNEKSNDSPSLTEKLNDADKTAPVFAERYIFEDMRMEVRDVRSKLAEQLTTKVGTPDTTAAEKSAALDEMAEMTKRTSDETLMELQIVALGYPEVFVHREDNGVKITVMAMEGQSKTLADEIIRHVKTSWSDAGTVQVVFTGGTEE
ncbi:SpoIIIAH-like family protein [Sporosarcina sp. FSL K6-2383]|uniref:SpoIIIAH-like family protein n=1 Tax=Sporosarcina sp. FSL K6-2383 TaxID=2921556 RepID=UPI00315B2BA1